MTICKLCGKEIKKYGMGGHMVMAHSEQGKITLAKANVARKSKKSGPAWNSGLTKDTDDRVKKISTSLVGRSKSDETKKKISKNAKNQGFGGYNPKGGRGKKGWYKGYWCDSSWELAWVIFNLDNNIVFSKNTKKFSYTYRGKTKNYIPDFLLESGQYIEVKGYYTEEVREKIKQFPYIIEVFDLKKMKPILDYVEMKYGKDFVRLYEEDRSDGH